MRCRLIILNTLFLFLQSINVSGASSEIMATPSEAADSSCAPVTLSEHSETAATPQRIPQIQMSGFWGPIMPFLSKFWDDTFISWANFWLWRLQNPKIYWQQLLAVSACLYGTFKVSEMLTRRRSQCSSWFDTFCDAKYHGRRSLGKVGSPRTDISITHHVWT